MTQPQAPGLQGTTQETPRVLKRRSLEYFVFQFFYDKDKTQPVMPLDPQQYPNFRIVSPSGDLMGQGTAIPAGAPGYWKVGFAVPPNAPLTNVHKRYKFQTVMVDKDLRQFETSFEFDVVDPAVPAQNPELQQRVAFVGDGLRLRFVNTVRPEMLKVRVVPRGQDLNPIHVASFTYPVPVSPSVNDIIETEVGNAYVYYTDIPVFPAAGEYSALWSVRDSATAEQQTEHQAIDVVTTSTMHNVKSLRMLIDKLQKKLGLVYAYTNEDIIEYLRLGASYINSQFPPTYYGVDCMPEPLHAFFIYAAAWNALTAQRLLYGETKFDFSGQTVTLGYDPGADLDGIISNFATMLEKISAAKRGLVRAASSVGSVATRPLTYRSGLVYKKNNYVPQNTQMLLGQLADYGIILDY